MLSLETVLDHEFQTHFSEMFFPPSILSLRKLSPFNILLPVLCGFVGQDESEGSGIFHQCHIDGILDRGRKLHTQWD